MRYFHFLLNKGDFLSTRRKRALLGAPKVPISGDGGAAGSAPSSAICSRAARHQTVPGTGSGTGTNTGSTGTGSTVTISEPPGSRGATRAPCGARGCALGRSPRQGGEGKENGTGLKKIK